METMLDEVADGIYRISTLVPDGAPGGFSFNQFLVLADEPLLFHAGPRSMFPQVADAVGRVMPVSSLRWVSFGHVESDECGAMNLWLEAAPRSEVAYGVFGVQVEQGLEVTTVEVVGVVEPQTPDVFEVIELLRSSHHRCLLHRRPRLLPSFPPV